MSIIKEKVLRKQYNDTLAKMAHINARLLSTSKLHSETFGPYKNYCNAEKPIVVCCAGPSLNDFVPIEGAIYIAVNRAFLYEKVHFDFIFAQDFQGVNMVQNQLVNYDCVKFLGTQGNKKKVIPETLIIKSGAKKFDTDWYIPGAGRGGELVVDIDRLPICNMVNVGQSVMQLALFMNPTKIYIVGADMSGAHFTKGNLSEQEAKDEKEKMDSYWNSSFFEVTYKRWLEVKDFAEVNYPDVEIISVNPVGLKGVFKDLYQNGK